MTGTGLEQTRDRLAAVDRILADPPDVHAFEAEHMMPAPAGVWSSEAGLYRFLVGRCAPGSQTLETGLGISTVLFAMVGTHHTCVVPLREEVDRCIAYCRAREISLDRVTFHVGWSDEVLPGLSSAALDLVLIDGGHAFPIPILDWYFAGGRLRQGGILLVDDVQLPMVSQSLVGFLEKDPRWKKLAHTPKWGAYERLSAGTLREGWGAQPERGIFPWRTRRSVIHRAGALAGRVLRGPGDRRGT